MRQLTKGRWWVFFLGDQKEYTLPSGSKVIVPSDADLLEWVRLMDIAADNFMAHMKLDFIGNGLPKHKLYVNFTGTGTGGAPAAFSGSNDSPYGVNTAIFDFGAIMHELGHACYPRGPSDKNLRIKCCGDPLVNYKEKPYYHGMMIGESIFGNFFGWYCFLSMIHAEPNHPLLKPYIGICEFPIQEHFALRSQLAFDATFYLFPLWKPENDGVADGTRARLGVETFSNGLSMPLLAKIEGKYGSRYSTNYPIVYFYRKYGIKFIVVLLYNLYRFPCMLQTICFLLGGNSNPNDFMLEYAIDWVFQAYTTGTKGDLLRKTKVPYMYCKNRKGSKNVKDTLEWKGFEVFDVREIVPNATGNIYFEFIVNTHAEDWRFAFAQGMPAVAPTGYSNISIVRQKGAGEDQLLSGIINGDDPAYLILVAGGVTHTDSMPGYTIKVRTRKTGDSIATISALPGQRPEVELYVPPLKDFLKNPDDYDPPSCKGQGVPSKDCIQSLWNEYGCTQKVPSTSYNTKYAAMRDFSRIIAGPDSHTCFGRNNVCAGFTVDQLPSKDCIRRMWHRAGCSRFMPEKVYPVDMGYNPGLKLYASLPLSRVEQNFKDYIMCIDQKNGCYEPARAFACKVDLSEHVTIKMSLLDRSPTQQEQQQNKQEQQNNKTKSTNNFILSCMCCCIPCFFIIVFMIVILRGKTKVRLRF